MSYVRRIATRWGRWISSGFIASLLFSQVALAMYSCPKLDSAEHVASMQVAGMAMEDAASMPSMPDCHAMPGTMDAQAPQLCHAHCDNDGRLVSSMQGVDSQTVAAHVLWIAYFLPTVFGVQQVDGPIAAYAPPDYRASFPPIYLTLQVLRN